MHNGSKIKIIQGEELLYSFDMEQAEEAYQKMAELEAMGLEVHLHVPTVTETLCDTLGLSHEQQEDYQQSVVAEIEDHDGGCCATPNTGLLH